MARNFIFGTKADTLGRLRPLLKTGTILEQFHFSVRDWRTSSLGIWEDLQVGGWLQRSVIVRSSAQSEDSLTESNAGIFTTVLNVTGEVEIQQAIENVIGSFGDRGNEKDQILIQPMLDTINMAGVVFTADLDTLAPYYIVNFDYSGSSESVTGGKDANLSTYIHFKYSPHVPKDTYLARLLESCQECESVTGNSFLDIEFAFGKDDTLYIFQVRPIVTHDKEDTVDKIDMKIALGKIYRKLEKSSIKHSNLLGGPAIYSVMTDWNPAEIIGIKPRPLALSLYRELITDNIRAFQRDNYGYRNLRSHPLLISFLGYPFIDVRVSFNSFIPKSLNEEIAEKLANYYINQLRTTPHYHDKVEFEIVHFCYDLHLPEKIQCLLKHGFSHNEIKRIKFALLELTNQVINTKNGLYKKDLQKIEMLKVRYQEIIHSELPQIEKIYWLIEDCKRYGTLSFSGVARAAFIAVQFLLSFVKLEIITTDDYFRFMQSLGTISKKLNNDLFEVREGRLSKDTFLQLYGHLRPGTYDILSPCYKENFENYFSLDTASYSEVEKFEFTTRQRHRIEQLLLENGIKVGVDELLQFIREAIEGREYAKFIFTRSLSEILNNLVLIGSQFDCTREELSFLNIHEIMELHHVLEPRDVGMILKDNIQKNRELYNYTKAVRLPKIILSPEEIYGFFLQKNEPNFITSKQVEGETILEKDFDNEMLNGKIALIPCSGRLP